MKNEKHYERNLPKALIWLAIVNESTGTVFFESTREKARVSI